jgi:DNA-binding NtrC family response regulator
VATHHNLVEDVEKGTFRRDLLYRIKVARLQLTPLRERPTDIPLLVHAFLGQFRSVMEKPVLQVSSEALRVLTSHSWPGNVRELKSAVESALIHCKGTVVRPEDLPPEVRSPEPQATYVPLPRQDERSRMLGALQQTGGNRSGAARLLGMSRRTFYRRLAEYDVAASAEFGADSFQ